MRDQASPKNTLASPTRVTLLGVVIAALWPALLSAAPPLPLKGPQPAEVPQPLIAPEVSDALRAFFREAASLERKGAEFLAHYQAFIAALDADRSGRRPHRSDAQCLALDFWDPYSRAQQSLDAYRRQSRVARAAIRPIEMYGDAGYSKGLTPDLDSQVNAALDAWEGLSNQHRALQVMLDEQMIPEVQLMGCNPNLQSLAPEWSPMSAGTAQATAQGGATAVQVAVSEPAPPPPGLHPPIKASWGQAIAAPAPRRAAAVPEMTDLPAAAEHPLLTSPLAATFVVDNTGCGQDLSVLVDGQSIGFVPAWTRAAFVTVEGPNKVCVSAGDGPHCPDSVGAIDAVIYDGWSLQPGC